MYQDPSHSPCVVENVPPPDDLGPPYLRNLIIIKAVGHGDDPPLAENGAAAEMMSLFLNAHLPWKLTHLSLLPSYDPGVSGFAVIQGSRTTFCRKQKPKGKPDHPSTSVGTGWVWLAGRNPWGWSEARTPRFPHCDRKEPMALDGVGVKVLALSPFFMGSQAGSFTKPASTQ